MKKFNFRNEPTIQKLPRNKLIAGILIGLFYALIFYLFLYLIREVFRLLTISEQHDVLILTDKEVNFYNLFLAFISVILAQSIILYYWFDKPRQFQEKRHFRITTILNDQRVMIWYFLSWFSRISSVLAVVTVGLIPRFHYVLDFYQQYKYLPLLIIIVLFLQTWTTIGQTFKGKRLKWMFYSALFISILSFGLSRINIIDYHTLNEIILSKNIQHKYQIELPKIESSERITSHWKYENVYLARSKNQNDPEPIRIFQTEVENQNEQEEFFIVERSTLSYFNIDRKVSQLHIDQAIKMEQVNQLRYDLHQMGENRIAYAFIPKNREYDSRFYNYNSFMPNRDLRNTTWTNPKDSINYLYSFSNRINISQSDSGTYILNDKPVTAEEFKQEFSQFIAKDPNYVIHFKVNDQVSFSQYLTLLSLLRSLTDGLRKDYLQATYAQPFIELLEEEQHDVLSKYPFRMVEETTHFTTVIIEEDCFDCLYWF